MVQFSRPHDFLLVVYSNPVSVLHRFRDINTRLPHVTASDLEQ